MARIAFIGLGNMGGPMAANLAKSGHEVYAFDLYPESLKLAVSHGCHGCDSAAEAVSGAQFVVTMLPAGQHVKSLLSGPDGLFKKADGFTLFIDCSTIDVGTAKDLSDEARQLGLVYIDAPVSGGTAGAEAGTLSFMVGATSNAYLRAEPLLEAMGKNLFHAGESGAGQVAKVCNNMLLGILMAGTAEALNLGMNNGINPKTLSEIMKSSSGANWVLDNYNPVPGVIRTSPASNHYSGGFMVDLMCKDLGLAEAASLSSRSAIPLGSLVKGLFSLHQTKGHGVKDFSSLINLYQAN